MLAALLLTAGCQGVVGSTPPDGSSSGSGGDDGGSPIDRPASTDAPPAPTDAAPAPTDATPELPPLVDGGPPPVRDGGVPPAGADLTGHVNPMLGTTRNGQSFPGAARPFGMIQWSLDNAWQESNQYDYARPNFAGLSFVHYTGYGPRTGVMLPTAGAVTASPASVRTVPNTSTVSPYESKFRHEDETARPGYYRVRSSTGIDVELSVTDRAGVAKIVWPATTSAASLIFDLGNSQTSALASRPIYNQATIDSAARKLQGFVGKDTYRLYFVVEFDQPFASVATFDNATLQAGQTTSAIGTDVGAVVAFAPGATVNLRVGLSYVSVANAQMNLAAEIPPGTTIAAVAAQATARWNDILNRLLVNDANAPADEITKFYTNLYLTSLQPNVVSDVDGSYWGADNQRHMVGAGHAVYSTISAWDQGRGMWPLLAWLFPSLMSDVTQSYLLAAEQRSGQALPGFVFPFLASGAAYGFGAGPEYALPAQAHAFGARGFDTALALKHLVKLTTTTAIRMGPQSDYLAGHAHPENHLDFALTDFAVRQLALAVGDTTAAAALAGRAAKWRDTFHASAVDNGWTGYQWLKSGSAFQAFTTSTDGSGSATLNRFTESCSAQVSYSVPQDAAGLIQAMGGPAAFIQRYDDFFSQFSSIGSNFTDANTQKTCRYYSAANETDLRAPWLANWAGAPSRVQSVVQRILSTQYANSAQGLPGNNDWGALSAWYVSAALGLYPLIPGVGGFSVNTPRFEQVLVTYENGRQLLVNANSKPQSNGYISGLAINGASWDSTWIPLTEVQNDRALNSLDFGLSAQASSWGASPTPAHAPPSFGDQ